MTLFCQKYQSLENDLVVFVGAGVAACYRGYRLYDTNDTKALVTKWVNFYKKYRPILIRDIIHVSIDESQ